MNPNKEKTTKPREQLPQVHVSLIFGDRTMTRNRPTYNELRDGLDLITKTYRDSQTHHVPFYLFVADVIISKESDWDAILRNCQFPKLTVRVERSLTLRRSDEEDTLDCGSVCSAASVKSNASCYKKRSYSPEPERNDFVVDPNDNHDAPPFATPVQPGVATPNQPQAPQSVPMVQEVNGTSDNTVNLVKAIVAVLEQHPDKSQIVQEIAAVTLQLMLQHAPLVIGVLAQVATSEPELVKSLQLEAIASQLIAAANATKTSSSPVVNVANDLHVPCAAMEAPLSPIKEEASWTESFRNLNVEDSVAVDKPSNNADEEVNVFPILELNQNNSKSPMHHQVEGVEELANEQTPVGYASDEEEEFANRGPVPALFIDVDFAGPTFRVVPPSCPYDLFDVEIVNLSNTESFPDEVVLISLHDSLRMPEVVRVKKLGPKQSQKIALSCQLPSHPVHFIGKLALCAPEPIGFFGSKHCVIEFVVQEDTQKFVKHDEEMARVMHESFETEEHRQEMQDFAAAQLIAQELEREALEEQELHRREVIAAEEEASKREVEALLQRQQQEETDREFARLQEEEERAQMEQFDENYARVVAGEL
jgi:hypothetical protein